MKTAIVIFIGGGFGALSRYYLTLGTKLFWPGFPIGTLLANILASLLLGALIFEYSSRPTASLYLLLGVGFCGAFSTFSTFSMDTLSLIQKQQFTDAFLNVIYNVLFCLIATAIGFIVTQWMKAN